MISLLISGIAIAGVGTPSFAAPQDQPAQQEKDAKKQSFKGKVQDVDKEAKTMKVEGMLLRILTDTKLTKEGKPIKLDDINVGDRVIGTSRKTSDSEAEALIVKVNPQGENKEQSEQPKY